MSSSSSNSSNSSNLSSSSSSSSSGSSSSSSSSQSSSSSSGCAGTNQCYWDPQTQQLTCFGGNSTSLCESPFDRLQADIDVVKLGDPVVTNCLQIGTPSSSSSSGQTSSSIGGFLAARNVVLPTVEEGRAIVRVPNVHNPREWAIFTKKVTAPFTQLLLDGIGWQIYFLRGSAPVSFPKVTPATIPADVVDPIDMALCASITLPELSGMNQYWVPVTERYTLHGFRFAQLETPEWTVFLLRLSMVPAVMSARQPAPTPVPTRYVARRG